MDEPEQTPETLLEQLSASERAVRWRAARLLAHEIDVGRARGAQFRAACVPVLLEVLEEHDAHTAFDAEDAARRLVDIGERTQHVRICMARCLGRAEDERASLEATLSQRRSSSPPERETLHAGIDAYHSLIACLRRYLEDLRSSPVASFAPPAAATVTAVAQSRRPGKGGSASLLLPALALLVVLGGVAALLFGHRSRSEVNLNSALTAAERPPPAPSAAASGALVH